MKKFLLLSTIGTLLLSCSISKKPEFRYIDQIVVKNISMRDITLSADAVFHNPNILKGSLSIDDLHVFVDNIEVGTISSKQFDVPAKEEFSIPLEGSFSLSKIYNNSKNNILNSVLKVVQTDSLEIQYKGTIRYHLGEFSYPYTLDKKQNISIK